MHDLNLKLFYRTSFDVATVDPEREALWVVVQHIRSWVVGKWRRQGVEVCDETEQWSRFKSGRPACLDVAGVLRLESAALWTSDTTGKWACSISETISEETRAPREWRTEIGFEEHTRGSGRLSLVLSYGDRPGFLGFVQDEPSPTIPRLVSMIVRDKGLRCMPCGLDMAVPDGPLALSTGMFPEFWHDIVKNPDRRTPVVYVSPRPDEAGECRLLLDPGRVAEALGPSALVYYSRDAGFVNEMAYLVDHHLRCERGAVRVYLANVSEDGWYRHRYFTASDIERWGSDAVVAMLRRALAQDVNHYESMVRVDTVRSEYRTSQMRRRSERALEESEDAAQQLLDEAEAECLRLRARCDELEEENRRLASKDEDNAYRIDQLKRACANVGGGGVPELPMGRWPLDPSTIVGLFQLAFRDRIAFTERAWKSLDDCRADAPTLWNALYAICTTLYGLLTAAGGRDVQKEFRAATNYEYVPGAGTMTRKGKDLMAVYHDTFDGRDLLFEAHVKRGSKDADPKAVRIYLCYDEVSGRIVISWCGRHLPNYSTQKLH